MTRFFKRRNKLIWSNIYDGITIHKRPEFYVKFLAESTNFMASHKAVSIEIKMEYRACVVVGDFLDILNKLEHLTGTEDLCKFVRSILDMRKLFYK